MPTAQDYREFNRKVKYGVPHTSVNKNPERLYKLIYLPTGQYMAQDAPYAVCVARRNVLLRTGYSLSQLIIKPH